MVVFSNIFYLYIIIMNKTINNALEKIDGYLLTINRNTINGWYEIEIGIPNNWTFQKETKTITCETLNENNEGKLIKIKPKSVDVVIDDLIVFVTMIIHTNKKILEKENEFNDEMQRYKSELEEKTRRFYDELDELKKNSFNDLINDFDESVDSSISTSTKPKTPQKRGRKKKIEPKESKEVNDGQKE